MSVRNLDENTKCILTASLRVLATSVESARRRPTCSGKKINRSQKQRNKALTLARTYTQTPTENNTPDTHTTRITLQTPKRTTCSGEPKGEEYVCQGNTDENRK